MPSYSVQLAVYRQNDAKSRTLLLGIAHGAETDQEAREVFDMVKEMLDAAARNMRERHDAREADAAQGALFQDLPADEPSHMEKAS